eukprot:NODE_331_length_2397_cov_30.981498_g309_i0.p1 GENE.NODE_331_length_2397_cov_30.981498_g309_i0~~NODE_331_length_2397_cov_30.981498_g309_i0.p1  ORF type:complete len:764 (+),score=193.76 NODE_331_length_2397_cov_30.981498_g309_i0:58-2349(+)
MSAFEEFGMMPELVQALEEMEWYLPKPVQQESIPLILGGGDVMCAAETGSGKTGAFCLPIIQTVWEVLNSKVNPDKKKLALKECRLNRDDCDEAFRTSEDLFQCQARHPNSWAGARANFGVMEGKYYYEATLLDDGLVRLGWSTMEASRELGSDRLGFGFGGTAKKAFARQFDDYGVPFGKNDTVGCLLDRVEGKVLFMVNGKNQGEAFSPLPSALKEEALYPAVVMKNGHVVFNFGQKPWKHPPPAGYNSMASLKENVGQQEKLYEKFLRHKERTESGQGHHATALIIEPTLELAQQIADEIQKFIKFIEHPALNYSVIVGKKDIKNIMQELSSGPDIIVGTPGRLVAMLESRQMNLSQIRFMVLDEADRLSQDNLDVIMKLHSAILRSQKERVQICMFSATLHSPEITTLHKQICPNATWVDLKGRDYVPDTVHHGVVYVDPRHGHPVPVGDYTDDLMHARDNQNNAEAHASLMIKRIKPEMVQRLIDAYQMEQCLIFCRTRLDCDNLKDYLDKKGGGKKFAGKVEKGKENPYANVCLHSGYRPAERAQNLDMFKDGDVRLLICTDVAARGIDIKELPYVINVTLPDKEEDYIHRVGRVGRADRMGLAVSIVATEKEKVWYHGCPSRGEGCTNTNLTTEKGCAIWYNEPVLIKNIERRIGETIPEMGQDFRHPAHQPSHPGDKVVYGKTKAEAGQGMSDHIKAILDDRDELLRLEREAQSHHLTTPSMIAALVRGVTRTSDPIDAAPKAPKAYAALKKGRQ